MCFTSSLPSPTPPAPQVKDWTWTAISVQEFCLWRCLFDSSPAPHCLTGAHAISQSHWCWSERKTPLPELATYMAWGLWGAMSFLWSCAVKWWPNLMSFGLFGWRGCFDLVSSQSEKVWQTPTKSVLVWSLQLILFQEMAGKSYASQCYCMCSYVCFLTMPLLKD